MQAENIHPAVIYFSHTPEVKEKERKDLSLKTASPSLSQNEYVRLLENIQAEQVIFVDSDRFSLNSLKSWIQNYNYPYNDQVIGYIPVKKPKLWLGTIRNLWNADPDIVHSPLLIGTKTAFLKAYGGSELTGNSLASVGYSLQKNGGMRFSPLKGEEYVKKESGKEKDKWKWWANYFFRLPAHYLCSGAFFKQICDKSGKVQRDMVFRMLFILFACFTFFFMPYISKDYGVTGDEFVDHRHAGYVLDYFAKGDKAALNQPKTALHLYGNSVQVITSAICRWFDVENYYELRHFTGGIVGAVGILAVGLMGLRWGGGLCGLLSLLLMFFTPRYFGHSMNNLKDIPFAVGYMLSLFYTVRLFDYYPVFRLRHIIGLILGIALALGTRSGGLILYPMLIMYAGLYFILRYGIKDFYKIGKHVNDIGRIFKILIVIVICSYFLSILLWPFALEKPLSGVIYSLSKFTNYNIGLRTIFDGEQMMSNMLPWKYAPKYLYIGMPVITITGFFAYLIYMVVRRKEFSLISYFFLFATIFPVFWVIYQHSNLYGGIRHLLFVMPPMVVIAGRFWSEFIHWGRRYYKIIAIIIFIGMFSLPVSHMIRNHPNEYVYFNEFAGGMKGTYGDYETDYYFNSLKRSADWFKKNVLPGLPKDKKTIVVSQASAALEYYFRKDTNIHVIYSRYYEKYAKDWDYAIFGNVYISRFQLQNHLFPPSGALYSPTVDGYPMSFVLKRDTKSELKGFALEKKRKYTEALQVFEDFIKDHKQNEEVWSRMGKLYYMTGQFDKSKAALDNAVKLHPSLNEALYMTALVNMELKDNTAAFNAVERMLAENSSSADGWYLKAFLYYQMKQYQKAIDALNHLLSFRPNFDRGLVLAGDIFKDHSDYKQAAAMYERALKYRNTINTQVLLADMLARMKNYKQAEDILKKAQDFQASYYPIYKVQSRILLQQGRVKEAAGLLKRMEAINNDAELFVLRAMCAEQMEDKATMRLMVEKALRQQPDNREALRLKKQL